MKSFQRFLHIQLLVIPVFFLVLLSACSSFQGGAFFLSGARPTESPIRISNTVTGTSITVSPPILHLTPGEGVVWINQTMYDVRINFDSDAVEGPSVIPRHSTVREKFSEVGHYSYTLLFSSSKTFGKVRGEIVVREPEPQHQPPSIIPDNEPSQKRPPVGMPEVISF